MGEYTRQAGLEGGKAWYKGGRGGDRAVWYHAGEGEWLVGQKNCVGTIPTTSRYIYAKSKSTAATPDAVQAGTWVPIKFNGMLFTAQLPPETPTSGPSFRQWGASNWWQNTRLAYWNMNAAADFAQLSTLFSYYEQMVPFLGARTAAAFNHTGLFVTETKTLFGAYDPCDYGTEAEWREDVPPPCQGGLPEGSWEQCGVHYAATTGWALLNVALILAIGWWMERRGIVITL